MANKETPTPGAGAERDYGVVPKSGEERTQVYDQPDGTRVLESGDADRTMAALPPGASASANATADNAADAATATAATASSNGPVLNRNEPIRPESDTARVLRSVGEGTMATGRVFGKAGGVVGGRIRKVTRAGGAGESGLAHLIELHAVNGVGDLMVTLALAQSVFFGVAPGQARPKVALYLLITMVPFIVLAPVIGPLLDRFGHGRRIAMALTMASRLVLALVMARTVTSDAAFALYPAAFGCLAASRAYGITRSAVIPRLLPPGTTLVKANSRTSMAQIAATFVLAPVAGLLVHFGAQYALMGAAAVFAFGAYLAIRLPAHVDSAEGEQKAQLRKGDRDLDPRLAETMPNLRLRAVGPAVVLALRANSAFRMFAGFLTIFLAFQVRLNPFDHPGFVASAHRVLLPNGKTDHIEHSSTKELVALGAVATAAAIGNAIGTSLGAVLKARAPEAVISTMLALATGAVLMTAFFWNFYMVVTVAFVAGLANALAKLSLDALLQRDTLERVRTSAFARSETVLQLSWCIGGGLGIALSFPHNGTLSFFLASLGMLSVCLMTLKALSDLRYLPPNPAQQVGFSV